MPQHTTIAIDIAKNVFEIAVSERPGVINERRSLRRADLLEFFANREPARVVMEACGSAHHWARQLIGLGHHVRLLPAHLVRPYVKRGKKTDRTDAAGLLEADRCAEIKPVPVKTPAQQAIVALHRLRQAWMDTRTARLNIARAFLRELGIFIPVGPKHVLPMLSCVATDPDAEIPDSLRPSLGVLAQELRDLERRIAQIEDELQAVADHTPAIKTLLTIPGIGLLTATALFAAVGDPHRFRSARHLASFLGLTPREHSSGERRRLGPIHKHGDSYLRMLLTHGARALIATKPPAGVNDRLRTWASQVAARRNTNVATVALANKLVRVAWAVWARGATFQRQPLRSAA